MGVDVSACACAWGSFLFAAVMGLSGFLRAGDGAGHDLQFNHVIHM